MSAHSDAPVKSPCSLRRPREHCLDLLVLEDCVGSLAQDATPLNPQHLLFDRVPHHEAVHVGLRRLPHAVHASGRLQLQIIAVLRLHHEHVASAHQMGAGAVRTKIHDTDLTVTGGGAFYSDAVCARGRRWEACQAPLLPQIRLSAPHSVICILQCQPPPLSAVTATLTATCTITFTLTGLALLSSTPLSHGSLQ